MFGSSFRVFVSSFRCVTSSLRFVVPFAISSCFVLSFRHFDVSLFHFLASFRRPSCNVVLSSPRFVISLFRFVTSLVVSSVRCFVSSFRFTVSFRRFNCAGLGTIKGTVRMYVTWSGYSDSRRCCRFVQRWTKLKISWKTVYKKSNKFLMIAALARRLVKTLIVTQQGNLCLNEPPLLSANFDFNKLPQRRKYESANIFLPS